MGKTKITGAIGDAVRSGTPIFLPAEFPASSEFEGLIHHYQDTSDLVRSLMNVLVDYQELTQSARETAQQFDLEKQAQRMETLCREVIAENDHSDALYSAH
jgi:uncharacterized membrane-anchored protein YhcB (DUF1043 family)